MQEEGKNDHSDEGSGDTDSEEKEDIESKFQQRERLGGYLQGMNVFQMSPYASQDTLWKKAVAGLTNQGPGQCHQGSAKGTMFKPTFKKVGNDNSGAYH